MNAAFAELRRTPRQAALCCTVFDRQQWNPIVRHLVPRRYTNGAPSPSAAGTAVPPASRDRPPHVDLRGDRRRFDDPLDGPGQVGHFISPNSDRSSIGWLSTSDPTRVAEQQPLAVVREAEHAPGRRGPVDFVRVRNEESFAERVGDDERAICEEVPTGTSSGQ